MTFAAALAIVLELEGGYANNPKDPGGETKYGISKRQYPSLDIISLTREKAASIYKKDYWDKCRCDELPPRMALIVFDTAVNQGVVYSVRNYQDVLGVDSDGIVGPRTIQAAHNQDSWAIVDEFMLQRLMRYCGNELFRTFGRGWMKRVVRILREVGVYNSKFEDQPYPPSSDEICDGSDRPPYLHDET